MDQSQIKKKVSTIIVLSMIILFCIFVGVIFQIVKINQLKKQKAQQEKYLQTLDSQLSMLSFDSEVCIDKQSNTLTFQI